MISFCKKIVKFTFFRHNALSDNYMYAIICMIQEGYAKLTCLLSKKSLNQKEHTQWPCHEAVHLSLFIAF